MIRKSVRRLGALFRYVRLATLLTLIGVLIIAISFGALRPGSFNNPLLTTTVNAATESFYFQTPDEREFAWSLPPGEFSILGTTESEQCKSNRIEAVCVYQENTRLVVKRSANVTMQASPGAGWSLSIVETETAPTEIYLYDAKGKMLLQSQQLLEFHAATLQSAIRLPFVADSAVLGSDLHQPSTIDGTEYDFWQPVLLSGDVLMIADNRPGRETYKVHEERLDPGDVLHVGDSESAAQVDGQSTVWGMVTVALVDEPDRFDNIAFQVVLHTSLHEVSVTRFGAPEGHVIRASYWTIRQKWPNGQSAWIFFVSAILVLTFILQLGDTLAAGQKDNKSRKKPKKNRKRRKDEK